MRRNFLKAMGLGGFTAMLPWQEAEALQERELVVSQPIMGQIPIPETEGYWAFHIHGTSPQNISLVEGGALPSAKASK